MQILELSVSCFRRTGYNLLTGGARDAGDFLCLQRNMISSIAIDAVWKRLVEANLIEPK
jgi:hypothetical protein